MLRDVAAAPDADAWGIGGMLFFLAFFVVVLFRVVIGKREDYERFGRIPLDDESHPDQTASAGAEKPNKSSIRSVQGATPANPKTPEGEPVVAEPLPGE